MQETTQCICVSHASAGLARHDGTCPGQRRATLFEAHSTTTPTSTSFKWLYSHHPATTQLQPLHLFPIPILDVMASFGGAGLGQKVIKPNPYVAAFSIALRQTYLFLGSSLSSSTSANSVLYRPERGSFPLDHDGTARPPAILPALPASLPAAHHISASDATFQASARI